MPCKDIIFLFTPIHTGTHFVRMLLESHPAIGIAIGEDYRVDRKFRPNYVLTGNGKGTVNGPLRQAEPMLLEYFKSFLRGNGDGRRFRKAMENWKTISSERFWPLSNYDFHLEEVRREFLGLGITLPPKRERFLLFRGHCHQEYLAYDLSKLKERFHLVVTIRHPLLTILTILRRHLPSSWESDIEDYVSALRCVFSIENAFVFCTDLWQETPDKMESLLMFLGLQNQSATKEFLSTRPYVNKTVAKADTIRDKIYCFEYEHPPELLTTLSDAKRLLVENRLHPLLIPYWERIEHSGTLQHFERFGYRFDFSNS